MRPMAARKVCYHYNGPWISTGEEHRDDARRQKEGMDKEMERQGERVRRMWAEQRRTDPDWVEEGAEGS